MVGGFFIPPRRIFFSALYVAGEYPWGQLRWGCGYVFAPTPTMLTSVKIFLSADFLTSFFWVYFSCVFFLPVFMYSYCMI